MLYELGGANLYFRFIGKMMSRAYLGAPEKQLPLEIACKLLKNKLLTQVLFPSKKDLAINFMKSGVDCMKHPKGYRQTQLVETVRHFFQFDEYTNERRKNKNVFDAMSLRDILVELARTEGHDDVDYVYNTKEF